MLADPSRFTTPYTCRQRGSTVALPCFLWTMVLASTIFFTPEPDASPVSCHLASCCPQTSRRWATTATWRCCRWTTSRFGRRPPPCCRWSWAPCRSCSRAWWWWATPRGETTPASPRVGGRQHAVRKGRLKCGIANTARSSTWCAVVFCCRFAPDVLRVAACKGWSYSGVGVHGQWHLQLGVW